jgi:predicted nucleic-acid-binding Zn-ribbon protein
VSGDAKTGTVDARSGMIVMPFVCDECGYMELYVGEKERLESGQA